MFRRGFDRYLMIFWGFPERVQVQYFMKFSNMPSAVRAFAGKSLTARDASPRSRPGITLVEIMISVAIVAIGMLGMVGAFKYLNVGIQVAKQKSLANNIAQEKMAYLKNKSYYRVLVTTRTPDVPDANFTPAMTYDLAPNGVETITVGGITFERRVLIRKVSENTSGELTPHSWNDPDTGLKEVSVYVVWQDRGDWKKLELKNLIDNPERVNLSGTFKGNVHDASTMADIEGAVVRAQENPAQYGLTDASGDYSFTIEPGAYTLLASKAGYFPLIRPLTAIGAEPLEGQDFGLTKMSSGTITGKAYTRDHLVISQVVGSSLSTSGNYQEWVEVYNPTTWTWTMATGLGTGANEVIHFAYEEAGASMILPDIDYRTLSVAPGAYFLFANVDTVQAAGVTVSADAVYDIDGTFLNVDDVIQTGTPSPAGAVVIGNYAAMRADDIVGWNASGNANAAKKSAPEYETEAIDQSIGFELGEEYVRKSNSATVGWGEGRCYDTNDNNDDFVAQKPIIQIPHNTSSSEACLTGTPAAGALVFTDDGLSSPATANSAGDFNLTNVATGTWTIYLSSSGVYTTSGTYTGLSNGFVSTTPSIVLGTSTLYGYVTGLVTGVSGNPLSGIHMYSAGVPQVETGSNGRYTLPTLAGANTIIANYQNQEPAYLEFSSMNVIVNLGQVTPNVDFVLSYGGKISGKMTTNGVDPLPNVPVVALKNGVEQGNGISDSDGNFLISGSGISTGTYEVAPQLESSESCSPSSATITVEAGVTADAGVFTVSGAFGYITGKVTTGSATGPVITTGVLIYATTNTVTLGSTPPDISATLRGGSLVYYAGSSNAVGEYTIPVRGGFKYKLYAWYTTWNGSVPTTTRKEYIGSNDFTVQPNETVTKNFFW